MPTVLERLGESLNRHDLDAMLDCFDRDYRSDQPAHPNRGFGGKEQVRKNWSGMFESFPDFEAELLRHGSDGEVVWSECIGVPPVSGWRASSSWGERR